LKASDLKHTFCGATQALLKVNKNKKETFYSQPKNPEDVPAHLKPINLEMHEQCVIFQS